MVDRRRAITDENVLLARVLDEDDNFMTLEVGKNGRRDLEPGERGRYYRLVFVAGRPWESNG